MVKATLLTPDIATGERILQRLDAAGFPVPVALWIRTGDEGQWWLLLASSLYDKLGARKAYGRVFDAISASEPHWVTLPLRLESLLCPFVRAVRKIFGKTASVEGMHLGGQTIGDTWVHEAYVYRIR